MQMRCLVQLIVAASIAFFYSYASIAEECEGAVMYDLGEIVDWSVAKKNHEAHLLINKYYTDNFFRTTDQGIVPGVIKAVAKDPLTGRVVLQVDSSCRWSDGRSITADDVKAGIENLFQPWGDFSFPGKNVFEYGQAVLDGEAPLSKLGMIVEDPYTLSIATTVNLTYIKTLLAHSLYVPAPAKKIALDPEYWRGPELPKVSSGPYVPVERKGRVISLVRNPHYCGPKPHFARLQIVNGKTSADFVEKVATGLNVIYFQTLSNNVTNASLALEDIAAKYTELVTTKPGIWFAIVNRNRGAFASDDVLAAFRLALEWGGPSGIASMLSPAGEITDTIVPEEFLESAPKLERDRGSREARLEKAREILTKAGYSDSNPVLVKAIDADKRPVFRAILHAIESMFTQSLPVKYEIVDIPATGPDNFANLVKTNRVVNYDLRVGKWSTGLPTADYFLRYYAASPFAPDARRDDVNEKLRVISSSDDEQLVRQTEVELTELLQIGGHIEPLMRPRRKGLIKKGYKKVGFGHPAVINDVYPVDERPCD